MALSSATVGSLFRDVQAAGKSDRSSLAHAGCGGRGLLGDDPTGVLCHTRHCKSQQRRCSPKPADGHRGVRPLYLAAGRRDGIYYVADIGAAIGDGEDRTRGGFGCSAEEIAITRNASESLEILLWVSIFKSGDEILTSTQDYPRMITTLKQRELREGLKLNLIPDTDRTE